jgi:hypothetical protein
MGGLDDRSTTQMFSLALFERSSRSLLVIKLDSHSPYPHPRPPPRRTRPLFPCRSSSNRASENICVVERSDDGRRCGARENTHPIRTRDHHHVGPVHCSLADRPGLPLSPRRSHIEHRASENICVVERSDDGRRCGARENTRRMYGAVVGRPRIPFTSSARENRRRCRRGFLTPVVITFWPKKLVSRLVRGRLVFFWRWDFRFV